MVLVLGPPRSQGQTMDAPPPGPQGLSPRPAPSRRWGLPSRGGSWEGAVLPPPWHRRLRTRSLSGPRRREDACASGGRRQPQGRTPPGSRRMPRPALQTPADVPPSPLLLGARSDKHRGSALRRDEAEWASFGTYATGSSEPVFWGSTELGISSVVEIPVITCLGQQAAPHPGRGLQLPEERKGRERTFFQRGKCLFQNDEKAV